ncbi:hypothetical protein AGDE_08521 [Angomonas deanei]|uniref:DNA-directed RNA polymerase III subunit RPC3 n=1 Tax=Angomonas deanei TaxID=59799 RepID=A0A7G2BZ67_9TRYP|nr:hypothetical protein AGDE_08521 [Angomonas deanei]CAD2212798.1 hypothetical protein, conserved [Angomonas deanei]|eukprot:EPY32612.1 hypothetical protein AGDE_08521 [Angomonas deanei]
MTSAPTVQRRILTDHYKLLEYTVGKQFGPLAGSAVAALSGRGALTLRQIADAVLQEHTSGTSLSTARAVPSALHLPQQTGGKSEMTLDPSLLRDAAVKEVVGLLVLHRVVRYSPSSKQYRLSVGDAVLLRVLSPIIAGHVEHRYGTAGVALYAVLFQLGVVPWQSAVRLAQERQPAAAEEVLLTASRMEADGWLEFVGGGSSEEKPTRRKRGRQDTEEAASVETLSADPCRLSIPRIVKGLLQVALQNQLANYFSDVNHKVLAALLDMFFDTFPATSTEDELETVAADVEGGYPTFFPPMSESISLTHLIARLHQLYPEGKKEDVVLLLDWLCTSPAILTRHDDSYRLQTRAAVDFLQSDVIERVLFVRHGTVGVRLIKLLLQHHYVDDKVLAEEVIATPQKTREVLHAMMKDGYTLLQEVPRNGNVAERPPKNSSFLWTCSLTETLLPSVRNHVARTLLRAEERLSAQGGRLEQYGPSEGADSGVGEAPRNAAFNISQPDAISAWRSYVGLQSCSLSLMRLMFMIDYL